MCSYKTLRWLSGGVCGVSLLTVYCHPLMVFISWISSGQLSLVFLFSLNLFLASPMQPTSGAGFQRQFGASIRRSTGLAAGPSCNWVSALPLLHSLETSGAPYPLHGFVSFSVKWAGQLVYAGSMCYIVDTPNVGVHASLPNCKRSWIKFLFHFKIPMAFPGSSLASFSVIL